MTVASDNSKNSIIIGLNQKYVKQLSKFTDLNSSPAVAANYSNLTFARMKNRDK